MLERPRSGALNFGKEDLENHIEAPYSDALRNVPFSKIHGLANPRKPMAAF